MYHEVKELKRQSEELSAGERLAKVLGLPPEVVANLPEITMSGSRTLTVENHKGVVDYGEELIRINTGAGMLEIEGNGFDILAITDEVIALTGRIRALRFSE